jgi:hypothetical protein
LSLRTGTAFASLALLVGAVALAAQVLSFLFGEVARADDCDFEAFAVAVGQADIAGQAVRAEVHGVKGCGCFFDDLQRLAFGDDFAAHATGSFH